MNSLSKMSGTSHTLYYITPSLIDKVLIALNAVVYIVVSEDKFNKIFLPIVKNCFRTIITNVDSKKETPLAVTTIVVNF